MPNLFSTFKHLFPRALAWLMPFKGFLRKYIQGLSEYPAEIRDEADRVFLDVFPQTTRELERWEKQFNLTSTGSAQGRRDRIAAAWVAQGGQGKDYLESVIHKAFPDAFIHEWWIDTGGGGYTTINPNLFLTSSAFPNQFGQGQFGDGSQFSGPYSTVGGSLLVNKGPNITYLVPTDPRYYPQIIYVGAETWPNFVDIPLKRQDEFERILLKYFPDQFWIGLLANYVLAGVAWTAVIDPKFSGFPISGIAFAESLNRFVAVGALGKINYSDDEGETWNIVADPKFGSTLISGVTFSENSPDPKYVAVGGSGKMSFSPDGATWTLVGDSKFGSTNINDVVYGEDALKYVAVGSDGKISHSPDAETWTIASDSKFGGSIISGVTVSESLIRFVAVGSGGKMSWSDDGGVTWTAVVDPKFGGTQIIDVAFAEFGTKFVAVGLSGKMSWSSDGITWTAVADPKFGTDHILGIALAKSLGRFVAVGNSGKIRYSDDNGLTWNIVTDSKFDTTNINAVAFAELLERFVAVGNDGKISYS